MLCYLVMYIICCVKLVHAFGTHFYGSSLRKLHKKSSQRLTLLGKKNWSIEKRLRLHMIIGSKYIPYLVKRPTLLQVQWSNAFTSKLALLSHSVVAQNHNVRFALSIYGQDDHDSFLRSSVDALRNVLFNEMSVELSTKECHVDAIRELLIFSVVCKLSFNPIYFFCSFIHIQRNMWCNLWN